MQPKSDDAVRMMLLNQYPRWSGNNYFASNITVLHILTLPSVRDRKPVGLNHFLLVKEKVEPATGTIAAPTFGLEGARAQQLQPVKPAPFCGGHKLQGEGYSMNRRPGVIPGVCSPISRRRDVVQERREPAFRVSGLY